VPSTPLQEGRAHDDATFFEARHDVDTRDAILFHEFCREVGVAPSDAIRLEASSSSTAEAGSARGVHVNSAFQAGDVIFSIPLSSCFRDDEPPIWYDCAASSSAAAVAASHERRQDSRGNPGEGLIDNSDDSGGDDDDNSPPCLIAGSYNPSNWATRLAAKVLHAQLLIEDGCGDGDYDNSAHQKATWLWLKLLPDPDWLRSTLPVHWTPAVLRSACCASLELAVDSAYFSRAQAVQDLMSALSSVSPRLLWSSSSENAARDVEPANLRRLCENALDLVQTRSCRVPLHRIDRDFGQVSDRSEDGQGDVEGDVAPTDYEAEWSPPLRIIAPVFDMINHSPRPNAEFFVGGDPHQQQEQERLVVRALRELEPDEQVFIDYGVSARPAYRCLASYGFVPTTGRDNEDDNDYGDDDEDVAEVYIDGSRYEVTRSTVPEDIVLAVASDPSAAIATGNPTSTAEAAAALTPDVAIRLASRLSDVAYQLLLNPLNHESFGDSGCRANDGNTDAIVEDDGEGDDCGTESPSDVISAKLAASLRWNQHRILLACAMGLRDWAVSGGSI
jgi:hypothetical protein